MMEAESMTPGQVDIFEPSYRTGFVVKICFGFSLIIVLCAVVFYAYFDRTFDNRYVGALATLEGLSREMCYGIILSVLVQVLFLTLLIFFISLLWTHKIAGPLYRLRHSFQQVSAGNPSVVTRFRNSDQLQNIPVLLNSGLEQLRGDFGQLHKDIGDVQAEVEQLTADCCRRDEDEMRRGVQACEERLHQILKRIAL